MGLYTAIEDKYYGLMDLINKVIPVNKIIDPIDKKFPSFILFIIVILALIFSGLIYFGLIDLSELGFPDFFGGTASISMLIQDSSGSTLSGINASIEINNEQAIALTSDDYGEITFNANIGDSLYYTINATGYQTYSENFEVSQTTENIDIILQPEGDNDLTPTGSRSISFVENGYLISGRTITASFTCSNSNITPTPATETKTIGKFEVKVPEDCGSLYVTVRSDYYESLTNYPVPDNGLIELTPIETDKGIILAKVKNVSGQALSGIDVRLYDATDTARTVYRETTDSYGETEFSFTPGNYFIVAEDTDNQYEVKRSETKQVSANTTTTFEITMQEYGVNVPIIGYIDVNVIDAETGEQVDSDIKLYTQDEEENFILYMQRTDVNYASFPIVDDNQYFITVEAEGYLTPAPIEAVVDDIIIVELEKGNGGGIKVEVKDKDNYPRANVLLVLYYGDTDLPTGDEMHSDIYGKAFFETITPGYYYLKGFYQFQQGTTDYFEVLNDENVNVNLKLTANQGTIKVNVFNELEIKMSRDNYVIEFYKQSTEEVADYIEDPLGEFQFEVPQTVYAVIESSGYHKHQTISIPIIENDSQDLNVYLEKIISGQENPEITFEGLFDSSNELVENIEPNTSYYPQFKLVIPEGKSFEKIQAFARAGESFIEGDFTGKLADDSLYFDKSYALPVNSSATDSTWFTGVFADDTNPSHVDASKAKWFNLSFETSEDITVYEFRLKLKVKDIAELKPSELTLHYRALLADLTGYYFNPTDSYESDPMLLYSNSHNESFSIECGDYDFCLTKQVFDSEGQEITANGSGDFEVKENEKNSIEFLLYNNSEVNEIDSKFKQENIIVSESNDDRIKFYDFTAEGSSLDGESKNWVNGIDPLNETLSGTINLMESITTDTEFISVFEQDSEKPLIRTQLTNSTSDLLVQEDSSFKIRADTDMLITIQAIGESEPDFLQAFKDYSKITITVVDNSNNDVPVANARVSTAYGLNDYSEIGLTNSQGIIEWTGYTAQAYNEKVKFKAVKQDVRDSVKEIIVGGGETILEVQDDKGTEYNDDGPIEFEVSLMKANEENSNTVYLVNTSTTGLTITLIKGNSGPSQLQEENTIYLYGGGEPEEEHAIRLTNFSQYNLNEDKTNQNLEDYDESVVPNTPGLPVEIKLHSENDAYPQPTLKNGNLLIYYYIANYEIPLVKSIPVEIDIRPSYFIQLSEEPQPPLKETTAEVKATIDFYKEEIDKTVNLYVNRKISDAGTITGFSLPTNKYLNTTAMDSILEAENSKLNWDGLGEYTDFEKDEFQFQIIINPNEITEDVTIDNYFIDATVEFVGGETKTLKIPLEIEINNAPRAEESLLTLPEKIELTLEPNNEYHYENSFTITNDTTYNAIIKSTSFEPALPSDLDFQICGPNGCINTPVEAEDSMQLQYRSEYKGNTQQEVIFQTNLKFSTEFEGYSGTITQEIPVTITVKPETTPS
ncbi:MAG: hypothetical protein ABH821_06075, partial [archaeon]